MTPLIVTECSSIEIKRNFSFYVYELLIVPFSEFYISELFGTSDNIINERSTRHLRINRALFNLINRCLLVKTLKMFRIPCML